MDYSEDIISKVYDNFDIGFMFLINILTYIIIKVFEDLNKDESLNKWEKRIVLLFSIVVLFLTYKWGGYDDNLKLIYSSIMAPLFWSWFAKPILAKFNVDYKDYHDTLNK